MKKESRVFQSEKNVEKENIISTMYETNEKVK